MATASTVILLNFTLIALLITTSVAAPTPPTSYTNHTVGGSDGWFFNSTTNATATNYTSWAAKDTFNLGDYLVFMTNTNQTVIQTYNATTYRNCTVDDSSDNDTLVYNGGESEFGKSMTIVVPLTIEGSNYFFSGGNDGVQCQKGMAFQIIVNHGLGLPPSLNQPPPPPYISPPGSDTDVSPPIDIDGGASKTGGALRNEIQTRVGVYGIVVAVTALLLI